MLYFLLAFFFEELLCGTLFFFSFQWAVEIRIGIHYWYGILPKIPLLVDIFPTLLSGGLNVGIVQGHFSY